MFDRRKFLAVPFALALFASGCTVMEGRQTAGQYIDDATITTRVKAQMVEDPQVKAIEVGVETMQGVVQLSGFVPSQMVAQRAGQIARNVEGVRGVKNDLVVR